MPKIWYTVLIVIFLSLYACSNSENKGDYVLIVHVSDYPSEAKVVEQALQKGGQIGINVSKAMELDSNFENKYAVADSEGSYQVIPALLNFVGDRGWTLVQVFCINLNAENKEYFFTKKR